MTDIVLPETIEGIFEEIIKSPNMSSISIGVFKDHSLSMDQGFIITYIEIYDDNGVLYTIKVEFYVDRITYLWVDVRISENDSSKPSKYGLYNYGRFPNLVRLSLLEQLFFKLEDFWGKSLEHDLWDQLHMTIAVIKKL